jgi:hypothetical protein
MKTLYSSAFVCFFLAVFSAPAQVTDPTRLNQGGAGPITVSAAAGVPVSVATNGVVPPTITWLPDEAAAPIEALPPGLIVAEAEGVTVLQETTNGQTVVRFVHLGNPARSPAANGSGLGAGLNGNSPQPLDGVGGCVSPPAGMLAWWPGDGNTNDIVGAHNGQTPYGFAYAAGEVLQAFAFNGSQCVQVPYAPDLMTPAFTMEAWVKPSQPTWQHVVLGQAYGRQLLLQWASGGVNAAFYVTAPWGWFYGPLPAPIPLNQWTHLASSFDPGTGYLKLFTNGVLAHSAAYSYGLGDSYLDWGIGGWTSFGQYFPSGGEIDEVSLYNRALLDGEINAIYQAGAAGKCQPPPPCAPCPQPAVASWPGEGDASDMFNNNHPGTLQNGVSFAQGMVARAFSFNPTNQQAVELPAIPGLCASPFSLEAWIKPMALASDSPGQTFLFGESFCGQLLARNGQQGVRVAFDIASNRWIFQEVLATNDLPLGQWSHVVGVYAGSVMSLYVNGGLVQQAQVTLTPYDAGCPLHLGGVYDPSAGTCTYVGQFFNGLVDEATVYGRALTGAEVQALYNAGGSGKCGSLGAWLQHYFGPDCWNQPYATAYADADGDLVPNIQEFWNDTDPNKIRFSISVTNQYVTTTTVPLQLHIAGGVPSVISVMINSTNLNWQTFTSTNLSVSTPADGVYVVWVALRGLPDDGAQTWQSVTVFRDTTPLGLTLTNLPALSGSRPFLDPAGYASRALSSITWTLIDANGNTNTGNGAVIGGNWSLSDPFHTTNWFQCVDLPLALGMNQISIRAVDWVGSVAQTNFAYLFATNGDSTPPSLTLLWPPNGSQVSGDSLTVQARTDDDTAAVALQYTDANGMVQTVNGIVERGGNVWVPSVPLAAGTNGFSLVATDAAGNMSTNHFTAVRNSVALTVSPVSQRLLQYCSAPVSVTVGAAASAVMVNGHPGNSTDGLNWRVESVPLPPGGTVTLQATAQLNDGTTLHTLLTQERDPIVFTQTYHYKLDYSDVFMATGKVAQATETHHTEFHWERGAGGTNLQTQYGSQPGPPVTFSNVTRTVWPPDNGYLPSLWGQQVYLHYEDGQLLSSSTTNVPLPSLQWMERSATAGVLAGDFPVPYSESSGREVRLFTGGSAVRQRQALFDLSASLTCESEVIPEPSQWAQMDGSSPFLQPANPPVAVPPEQITLGGEGHLGSDGHLWTVQANGAELEITPQAPATSYNGQKPGQQKYNLHVLAQTLPLQPDLVANGANFCVGQNVPFQLETPPAGVTAMNFQWTLEGTYVNDHTNAVHGGSPPTSSENYFENTNWLANPVVTNCWWVSGGFNPPQTYEALVSCWLVFANGNAPQPYEAEGQFTMHRPRVIMLNPALHGTPANVWRSSPSLWQLGGAGQIGLGLSSESLITNNMSYVVGIVSSNFAGHAKITQVCSINATGAGMTHCTNWLDSADPYNQSAYRGVLMNFIPTNPLGGLNTMNLDDAPSASATLSQSIHMDDSFIDYVMFTPDESGPNSIYVPLGAISWSTTAGASWPDPTINPNWPIGPAGPDQSLAWPVWTNVFSNP